MSNVDAHDNRTRDFVNTFVDLVLYLTELAETDDPHIIKAGIPEHADTLASQLAAAYVDLKDIRNALARIDTRSTHDGDTQ